MEHHKLNTNPMLLKSYYLYYYVCPIKQAHIFFNNLIFSVGIFKDSLEFLGMAGYVKTELIS